MSNKFLPFISESSSVDSILKALLQRTKGIPAKKVGVLFSAILILGINKVKEKANSIPSSMSHSQMFETLTDAYMQYEIPQTVFNYWKYILKNFGAENLSCSSNFTKEEVIFLFCATAVNKPNNLKDLGFNIYKPFLSNAYVSDLNVPVTDLKKTAFKNEAAKIGFTCREEFLAYIAFHEVANKGKISLFPVILDKDKNYSKNAKSPYTEETDDVPF